MLRDRASWTEPHDAAPWLGPVEVSFTFVRYAIATTVIMVALVLVHKWLPAGRRRRGRDRARHRRRPCCSGLVIGVAFGRYLAEFAYTYVTTYAGLASAMVALVFLYWTASIFVYGGELNDAIRKWRASGVTP